MCKPYAALNLRTVILYDGHVHLIFTTQCCYCWNVAYSTNFSKQQTFENHFLILCKQQCFLFLDPGNHKTLAPIGGEISVILISSQFADKKACSMITDNDALASVSGETFFRRSLIKL